MEILMWKYIITCLRNVYFLISVTDIDVANTLVSLKGFSSKYLLLNSIYIYKIYINVFLLGGSELFSMGIIAIYEMLFLFKIISSIKIIYLQNL